MIQNNSKIKIWSKCWMLVLVHRNKSQQIDKTPSYQASHHLKGGGDQHYQYTMTGEGLPQWSIVFFHPYMYSEASIYYEPSWVHIILGSSSVYVEHWTGSLCVPQAHICCWVPETNLSITNGITRKKWLQGRHLAYVPVSVTATYFATGLC